MIPDLPNPNQLANRVFTLSNEKHFAQIALEVFRYQFFHNSVYKAYCEAVNKTPDRVPGLYDIPFLPISFFKTHLIKSGAYEAVTLFKSSGTTSATTSHHYIKDLGLYERSFYTCFRQFFGDPQQYCMVGLLPSYLEQGNSSLVYMVDAFIRESKHPSSGFYLYDHAGLKQTIQTLEASGQPTILFGVTYALLDFAETAAMPLQHTTLIETGGMKGRKQELTKPALYEQLKKAFSLSTIHSEYGMTELLSQAYASDGLYRCPPWMQVVLRDETDPFTLGVNRGAINVIDLANIHSCSFIATEDVGRLHSNGAFEVLGRMDNTDIRGCSQLAL